MVKEYLVSQLVHFLQHLLLKEDSETKLKFQNDAEIITFSLSGYFL